MSRTAVLLALLPLACNTSPTPDAPAPTRPNVVLVMTDDQGFGDFGFAGNPVLRTPHLDAMAQRSARMETFYVSPVCAPTRASLMTGRYNYRTRAVDTYRGRAQMDTDEVTLAEVLGEAGYATGIFGKWHLGDAHPLRPMDQGFERSLVHGGGGLTQPADPIANDRRYTNPILFEGGEPVQTTGFCTDVYADAAIEFIDGSLDEQRPFFAYVATNAPHGPYHDVPEDLRAKYAAMDLSAVLVGGGADREARILAMVENIDSAFGRLLDHLEARGLERDTIVVFLSDNGPVWGRYNAGLRGFKSAPYEGGIRSPLWMRWPERLSADTRVDVPLAHIDLMPTLVEAVGLDMPTGRTIDGQSALDHLQGDPAAAPELADRQLVLQSHRGDVPAPEHHFALIGPRWKLVRASGFGKNEPPADPPFELFDLAADPGETQDLAAAHPELVAELRADYAAWFQDVSTTRPDNYAPPRIVPGSPAETTTLLSRQDWRPLLAGGEPKGWGSQGAWLLRLERETELRITLLFQEPRALGAAAVHIGERAIAVGPFEAAGRIDLGPMAFPAGELDLWIECHNGDGSFAPWQVELELP